MAKHSYAGAVGLALVVLPMVMAGFNNQSTHSIAVYWGQNSYNQASGSYMQERLVYYCQNLDIDIIPLAFMSGISPPITNFANAGNNCTTFTNNPNMLNCPQLARDIAECQHAFGKTIILSLGGATYTQVGWPTIFEARAAAQQVWNMFGTNPASGVDRPFGTSVIDGFDFDFESRVSNLEAFAAELRRLMDSSGKRMYLTAAPQCVFPDYADNTALSSSVPFDFIMVQYYNNGCGASSFAFGAAEQQNFNFDVWDNWARNISANRNVKVLLGLPANTDAATGYVSSTQLYDVITFCKQYASFGGIMLWDMSQLYANPGFLSQVVSHLGPDSTLPHSPSATALSIPSPITYRSTITHSHRSCPRAFDGATRVHQYT